MILVKEATSCPFLLLNETIIFSSAPYNISQITYDLAVIFGGGLNGFA